MKRIVRITEVGNLRYETDIRVLCDNCGCVVDKFSDAYGEEVHEGKMQIISCLPCAIKCEERNVEAYRRDIANFERRIVATTQRIAELKKSQNKEKADNDPEEDPTTE